MINQSGLTAIGTCLLTGLMTGIAAAGSWSEMSVARMQVELFVPDAPPQSAAGRPLMVSLHGCVQNGDHLRERGNWAPTAEAFGMVVALPTVPDGGKILGCWDYYGKPSLQAPSTPPHTRQNRDNDNILALVGRLLDDERLGIDPKQVYLSGLSSGGGETMVLGCLAPDVFAGVGIVAGPSLGTASDEIKPPTALPVSRDQVIRSCESLAGANASHLATQVTSVAFGSNDTIVSPAYNHLNAEAMAALYGATPSGTFDLSGLPGFQPQGQGSLWNDAKGPRVSLVRINGMGHAWPAGSGPGGEPNFISLRGLNYPAYLTKFLTDNNRRLALPPRLTAEANVDHTALTVRIVGEADAADGSLDALRIELIGLSEPTFRFGPVDVPQPSPPSFSFTSGQLPTNAAYRATVRALDAGAETVAELRFGVGPNPRFPPVLGKIMSSVDMGCVTLFGPVEDQNGDLDKVVVAIDGSAIDGVMLNAARDSWTLSQPTCNLQPGRHNAVATALDLGGLRSEPIDVRIDIPQPFITVTDTLNGHVIAQRVRFYPEAGHFGTRDVPFAALFMQHGSLTPFALFGIDKVFFANRPASVAPSVALRMTEPAAGRAGPRVQTTTPSTDPLMNFLNALTASGMDVSISISRRAND
jgi:poly(3-hydroxybutyrate) depolymerase